MIMRRYALTALLLILLVSGGVIHAQENNGRFCVRVFVDGNGNAAQETGEAPVTQGVGADLRARNSEVILASQLMQDAPNRRAGEICFTGLQLGQYEITINSALYDIPAGDDTVFTEVSDTQPVITASYGVPPLPAVVGDLNADDEVDREAVLERSLVAGAGSLIAMALTAFLGIVIYALFLRRRRQTVPVGAPDDRYRQSTSTDTGSFRPTDTGEIDYNYRSPPE